MPIPKETKEKLGLQKSKQQWLDTEIPLKEHMCHIKDAQQEYDTNNIIVTLNCNSLNNSKEQLKNFIREVTAVREPVAVLLQETYLKQE